MNVKWLDDAFARLEFQLDDLPLQHSEWTGRALREVFVPLKEILTAIRAQMIEQELELQRIRKRRK